MLNVDVLIWLWLAILILIKTLCCFGCDYALNHGFQLINLTLKLDRGSHGAGGFESVKGVFDLRELHDDVAIVQDVDRLRIREEA